MFIKTKKYPSQYTCVNDSHKHSDEIQDTEEFARTLRKSSQVGPIDQYFLKEI